jgi:predicted GNAT superfamily acetyltransferase
MTITVRPLTTLAECDHFQKVQMQIWGGDEEGIMPSHVLITLARNGGLVMGAYADDGPAETGGMVGIVAGWLGSDIPHGETKPRIKFCSHMAGVLPPWQRQRVGLRLKVAQAEWVRAQGFTDWITWTYDPLYRANGVFNIHRLGATCCTYVRDFYGQMTDVLNAGGPSDRCKVDWWIDSERVKGAVDRTLQGEAGTRVPAPSPRYAGLRVLPTEAVGSLRKPVDREPSLDGAPLAVPIPEDIAAMRRLDRDLALEWRYYLRARLEQAFAVDYQIVDCLHIPVEGGHEWCYVMVRET